ncbi:MAG: efflux RND transporter periplasmic adaptor subunit [Methylovulum sp.]|nr:efflux RND transporter periplasmic adaptor subunit [Methylovulum sp.]
MNAQPFSVKSQETPTLICLLAVLSMSLMLLAGCDKNATPSTVVTPPKPTIVASQPLQHEIVEWDEFTGRLEAVESVDIRARVSGYLQKIGFQEGGKVKKGDLLFVVDPRPYLAQLHQAKAELDRATSRWELAQNDVQRAQRLLKEQAISEEEYDTRSKNVVQAAASVESAKAAVELAQLNVDFTQIRAPVPGQISRKLITEGNLVNADTTVLATIVSVDPIHVYIDADERSVLKYRRLSIEGKRQSARYFKIPLEMALLDETRYEHKGYIDYVDPEFNPATGTIRARGVFANPDDLLGPGLFARVRIPGSGKYQAILISDKAIAMDQGKQFVMVVNKDNRAEYRPIQTGRIHEGLRIVTAGLTVDDWVITNGLQFVRPGVEVEATHAPMQAELATGIVK